MEYVRISRLCQRTSDDGLICLRTSAAPICPHCGAICPHSSRHKVWREALGTKFCRLNVLIPTSIISFTVGMQPTCRSRSGRWCGRSWGMMHTSTSRMMRWLDRTLFFRRMTTNVTIKTMGTRGPYKMGTGVTVLLLSA